MIRICSVEVLNIFLGVFHIKIMCFLLYSRQFFTKVFVLWPTNYIKLNFPLNLGGLKKST